jgi:hypothetical protein
MNVFTREEVVAILQNEDLVEVSFTKKDGTERRMRCTLKMKEIPADKRPTGEGRPYTDQQVRVFDLDKQEWRSFTLESIISIYHYDRSLQKP